MHEASERSSAQRDSATRPGDVLHRAERLDVVGKCCHADSTAMRRLRGVHACAAARAETSTRSYSVPLLDRTLRHVPSCRRSTDATLPHHQRRRFLKRSMSRSHPSPSSGGLRRSWTRRTRCGPSAAPPSPNSTPSPNPSSSTCSATPPRIRRDGRCSDLTLMIDGIARTLSALGIRLEGVRRYPRTIKLATSMETMLLSLGRRPIESGHASKRRSW